MTCGLGPMSAVIVTFLRIDAEKLDLRTSPMLPMRSTYAGKVMAHHLKGFCIAAALYTQGLSQWYKCVVGWC